jgi:hypothetical protein
MPLILDPESYSRELLAALVRDLAEGLTETRDLVLQPRGRVLDPSSLLTAQELVDAALASLGRPGERSRAELAYDANLAYAAMISALDLVKSHTDAPRVPARRKPTAE